MKKQSPAAAFAAVAAVVVLSLSLSSCRRAPEGGGDAAVTPPVASPDGGDSVLPSPDPSPAGPDAKTVTVYKVVSGDKGIKLEKVEMPVGADADTPEKAALAALNYMAEQKDSPLPKDARARSVTISEDLATVDFNKAFEANFEGGDRREAVLFNAVTATLGQFEGVKQVQITVEGQKVAVGGTQDTTEPLPVGTGGGGETQSADAGR